MDLLGFREKLTLQGVGHCWGQRLRPWNVVLLAEWIHMLMSGRIVPTIGKPPTLPSFDSAFELFCHLWVCLLAYRLGIAWIWLVILDPVDFNWFMLCPCAMSFFQRLWSAPFFPVSCSFPQPHLGPQCCLYIILEGQPENSWPWEGNTV